MKFILSMMLGLFFGFIGSSVSFAGSTKSVEQKISGSIQGLGFPIIEIGIKGRGTRIDLGSEEKLQTLGITAAMFEIGDQIEATGKVTRGETQDRMEANSIKIGDKVFKLK